MLPGSAYARPYDDIPIPTDGSDEVQSAIDHVIELAAQLDASGHGLFVVDTTRSTTVSGTEWLGLKEALRETGQQAVADVEDRARQRGVEAVTAVREGSPSDAIVDYTDGAADLVVMGFHGRAGTDRVVLGSVTERVIRSADTPVLVRRVEEG